MFNAPFGIFLLQTCFPFPKQALFGKKEALFSREISYHHHIRLYYCSLYILLFIPSLGTYLWLCPKLWEQWQKQNKKQNMRKFFIEKCLFINMLLHLEDLSGDQGPIYNKYGANL